MYVPTPGEVAGLRRKYVEIRRLRLEAVANPELDPRREMAALAAEFPGALREADELPMDEIERRLALLETVDRTAAAIPLWVGVTVRFHALTRGALCAKRWLARRKEVDDGTEEAFEQAAGAFCYRSDALAWRSSLARLARPPRGRVTDLVFERLALELGVPEEAVRAQLFVDRGRWKTRRLDGGHDGVD